MPIPHAVTAASALPPTLSELDKTLDFPGELVESMTTDQIVGLLLLRMRALLARGFETSEALVVAARFAPDECVAAA
jgi:hypothetical protein